MTRILVTGFGSFPGAPVNPTAALVARLGRSRRAAMAGLRIATHVFATRYAAVDADLPALLAREKPDVLVMFGVALKAKHIRIELLARNRKSVLFPDAGGATAGGLAIARGAPAMRGGRFSLPAALAAVRAAGLRAVVSRDAGRYLCNYAYWRALEQAARPGGPRVVLFVHVPPLRLNPRPLRRVRRRRLIRFPADRFGLFLLPPPLWGRVGEGGNGLRKRHMHPPPGSHAAKPAQAAPACLRGDPTSPSRGEVTRTVPRRSSGKSMTPADLTRAGEALLLAAAAMARPPAARRG